MFSFTRFCLRVLADLNEIIRRLKQNVILTIAITGLFFANQLSKFRDGFFIVRAFENGRPGHKDINACI